MLKVWAGWVFSLVAVLCVLVAAPVSADPPPTLVAVPKQVHRSASGAVRQVVPDEPVPAPGGRPSDPAAAAAAHSASIEQLFGPGVDADLVVQRIAARGTGATVRMAQRAAGVPIYGADVALALNADGSLLSATGALAEATKGSFPPDGLVPPPTAVSAAVGRTAELAAAPPDSVRVNARGAAWYDPDLSGSGGPGQVAVPAFRFDTASGSGLWRVFVAATADPVVLGAWQTAENLTRVVCDAGESGDQDELDVPCGGNGSYPVTLVEDGRPAPAGTEAGQVYNWMGDTEAFYQRYTQLGSLTDLIGIDAGDGRGRALRATARVCETTCPYANAYWSAGRGFVIGSDAMGLDVVAHELTHGVTDRTDGLDYVNESGAINESMSDVFGEFTALTTGTDHPAGRRWKIGVTTAAGVVRDMRTPGSTKRPQPEYYRGPRWVPADYTDRAPVPDHGGVHTNSGVGNKLAYLLTDGDTFNGTTVRGLGIAKVAALYWTVQTELYPSADYPALASTLVTACAEDAAEGLAGLTSQDCTQVRNGIQAVRIPLLADHV